MKIVILYRPESEYARSVEEFIHELQSRYYEARLEVQDVDGREGSAMASLYDVVRYPAVMIVKEDGYLQQCWQGEPLPLIDEVIGLARA
jgi:hypothetical protein